MTISQDVFDTLLWVWIALAFILVPVQLIVIPPYGRHHRPSWGPVVGNRAGWVVMEIVPLFALLLPFVWTGWPGGAPVAIFVALWTAHYAHRSLIYPMTMRTSGKTIPLAIVASAIAFNAFNGWSNGYYLASGWGGYDRSWLSDPRFVSGVGLFFAGASINIWSDRSLVKLRARTQPNSYSIPRGGLFRYVSCPNHLGEIIEWSGFALACWNLPALAFALWTAANLAPRSLAHHRWYCATFADYPKGRRALIPFVL